MSWGSPKMSWESPKCPRGHQNVLGVTKNVLGVHRTVRWMPRIIQGAVPRAFGVRKRGFRDFWTKTPKQEGFQHVRARIALQAGCRQPGSNQVQDAIGYSAFGPVSPAKTLPVSLSIMMGSEGMGGALFPSFGFGAATSTIHALSVLEMVLISPLTPAASRYPLIVASSAGVAFFTGAVFISTLGQPAKPQTSTARQSPKTT